MFWYAQNHLLLPMVADLYCNPVGLKVLILMINKMKLYTRKGGRPKVELGRKRIYRINILLLFILIKNIRISTCVLIVLITMEKQFQIKTTVFEAKRFVKN